MARQRVGDIERPSSKTETPPEPQPAAALAASRLPPARARAAQLARSLAAGASLSNGAVTRVLMREIGGYWAGVADDPNYTAESPPTEAPATQGDDELNRLRRAFRAKIIETIERFAASPAVEGTPGFDEFLTPATVAAERTASVGWTSCITTLTKICNDAASVVNKALGVEVKRTPKGFLIDSMYGAVKYAGNAEAEKHARAVGAWTAWPGTDDLYAEVKDYKHPEPGDIIVLHKASGAFGHVGLFHSWRKAGSGEIWTTVDGGQGTMGKWEGGKYVAGSGRQEIKRRDRQYWPEDGKIEGEPGQGPTLKVHGWVNVEKLVLGAALST